MTYDDVQKMKHNLSATACDILLCKTVIFEEDAEHLSVCSVLLVCMLETDSSTTNVHVVSEAFAIYYVPRLCALLV